MIMNCQSQLFLSLFLSSLFISTHIGRGEAVKSDDGTVYIVYMGAATSTANNNKNSLRLGSLTMRNKSAIVHEYEHGFTGFAARLSESEALQMAKQAGVVSVFPDPVFQLHTTRSWDFLLYENSLLMNPPPYSSPQSSSHGEDTVIGIMDTGIWPESQSFNDESLGQIPDRWKGICMNGPDFDSSHCNKKIIGARYYGDQQSGGKESARDKMGHGTHVASTAAGAPVPDASYYGIAAGTAKGGSPTSRIAVYKVCSSDGCIGSNILKAFDDAIADGVDVLSLSLGSPAVLAMDLITDPIAIGAFHAVQNNIVVVCSAGNDGPEPKTVVNTAPWILTVAATTMDRIFETDLILGNNKLFMGEGISFSDLRKSPIYPMIDSPTSKDEQLKNCYPDFLNGFSIEGKIVLCQLSQHNDSALLTNEQTLGVKANGGIGVIYVSDKGKLEGNKAGSFPMTVIGSKEGAEVHKYITTTRNPTGTILPSQTVTNYKPAPTVAVFSARGPSYSTSNLLKPDIAAPGVNILASWIANDTRGTSIPIGKEPSNFNLLSGTSMACPHVTGVAATIKAQNRTWSPSAVMSAIMTTAIQTNNLKEPITTDFGEVATPYDMGAGQINPIGGLRPGLIYEMDPTDYLLFLCYYGYNISSIKLVSGELPQGFSCPKKSSTEMISNINYPSIAVTKSITEASVSVTRTVTNVDSDEETKYKVIVDEPEGLKVDVVPNMLCFTGSIKKLSYRVIFSSSSSSVSGDLFGAITWTNGKYKVRSPFVVSNHQQGHELFDV